jgi:NAD(P)-dependent dehydrogenase (short-subunit alcohol dehydrogenase family)
MVINGETASHGAAQQDPLSLFDLSGRVAIVTGGSSGIGSHIAGALAAAGATVVIAGRRSDRLEEVASRHVGVVAHQCDVSNDDECRRLVETTVSEQGRLDILVNNAGVSEPTKAELETPEDFRSTVAVNMVAPFILSQAAALHMLASSDGGSIVNIASIIGMVGIGRIPQASYAASKGGLVNLTRELAAQWARRGIRVNAVAPGWFPTEMTSDLFGNESGLDWVARLTPMGRGGELSELAGAVIFLASAASSYVTGVVLPVDGGWTAV